MSTTTETEADTRARYARMALFFLAYTVLVIVWGAYVRASFSGDGCGDHWPLCHGEVVPRAASTKTLVELAHRVTSGLDGVLAVVLVAVAYRRFPKGDPIRAASAGVLFFMVTEALVGAALVKLRLVAGNTSIARGGIMIAHLGNTFALLLASTALVFFARGGRRPSWRAAPGISLVAVVALVAMTLVGASGAIAALGDTLFPVSTLAEGLAQDRSPTAHLFVRLRVLHPALAIATSAGVVLFAAYLGARATRRELRRPAITLAALTVVQVGIGLLNLAWLAPVGIQLVHLAAADALFIVLVWTSARALEAPESISVAHPAVTSNVSNP